MREWLWHQVDLLPARYRAVLVLYYLRELSYDEIAEILELPLGTVKTHLFRAKAELKQRLEHQWPGRPAVDVPTGPEDEPPTRAQVRLDRPDDARREHDAMRLGALICALTRRRLPGLAARAAAAGETAPPRHVRQCLECKREWARWLSVEQSLWAGPEQPQTPDLLPGIIAALPAQAAPLPPAQHNRVAQWWPLAAGLAVLPALLVGSGDPAVLLVAAVDWLVGAAGSAWAAPFLALLGLVGGETALLGWLVPLLENTARSAETLLPALIALIALKPLVQRLAPAP